MAENNNFEMFIYAPLHMILPGEKMQNIEFSNLRYLLFSGIGLGHILCVISFLDIDIDTSEGTELSFD